MEDVKWLEVTLDTTEAELDALCARLTGNGVTGLAIEDEEDFKTFLEQNHQYWDYVDDELMEQMHGKSRITFYLEDSAGGYNTLAQFRIGLSAFKKQHPEYAPLILSMENVEDADWENNWKQFYKPMEIGERLLVVPEWEQAQEDGRVKLVLNPGLTFGTGSHATTRLCLQALEQHIHGGEKVLDLGCGSGILSIAALLLDFHHKGFEAVFHTQYVGKQYFTNNEIDALSLDSYCTTNLNLGYTLRTKAARSVRFGLMVYNLFDSEYCGNGYGYSYMDDGKRTDVALYFPQAPLNVLANVTVKF